MRLLGAIVLVGLLCVVICGCYTVPVKPPLGWVYTDVKAPLDVDYKDTPVGKSGEASTNAILSLVSWGDASSEAAAANGKLTTIDNADYEYFNVLCVYERFTTIVHGK